MAEIKMDDLKPNSHNYNRISEPDTEQEETPREPKELSGGFTTRKRPFLRQVTDIFLKDGANPKVIKRYLIEEIIVPAVLDNILDTITTALEMRFFGEVRRGNRRSTRSSSGRTGSVVNYGGYFTGGERRERPQRPAREISSFVPLEDVIFDTSEDAERILSDMQEILENYPQVTVSDYIDILKQYGIPVREIEPTDCKYGWKDLSMVTPRRARGGGYYLDLPREYVI